MGQWVIIIGNSELVADTIKAMTFEGAMSVRDYGEKQVDVLFQEGYVSFLFDSDKMIMNDYSPEEINNLPYDDPQFVLMRYSQRELLENVILSKDFPKDVLIDCGGVELGLDQIVDKSRLLDYNEEASK